MSLDLKIPCPKPFRVVELIVYTEKALKDLLDMTGETRVSVWRHSAREDEQLPLEAEIHEDMSLLGIGLSGLEESIQMLYYRIDREIDYVPPEEQGPVVGLAASGEEMVWGGAVRLALGAGVALGLARLQDTYIIDLKLSLTHQEKLNAAAFLEALQVKGPFHDFRNAAEAFFRRTSLQALNGKRLHILEIERDVDAMLMDLLGPLRIDHKVEWTAFNRFFALSDDWLAASEADPDMASKLESILILIREFLLDEARKAPGVMDIPRASSEIELRLGRLRARKP